MCAAERICLAVIALNHLRDTPISGRAQEINQPKRSQEHLIQDLEAERN